MCFTHFYDFYNKKQVVYNYCFNYYKYAIKKIGRIIEVPMMQYIFIMEINFLLYFIMRIFNVFIK
ncbi:hypothetical protein PFNF135_02844 [Plasmodium falciparum NF135/5.C10]|uniref:Uncharacterized protein n=1 Tax=Plasmodium falciparum NF135/5.C10 TaxID=1036726 RepID=W4IGE9_PLAFA|nr:hypothetical protein PFNF135_02844 [Plasmodium falciparum NF135/5.C10]